MLGSDCLIDSSVLIDLLRGRSDAIRFMESVHASSPITTHVIVAAELLTGARDLREQDTIDRLLFELDVLPCTASDCQNALALLRRYRLAGGIGWNDCLISATAMRLGRIVVTTNDKHFKAVEHLQVVRPY